MVGTVLHSPDPETNDMLRRLVGVDPLGAGDITPPTSTTVGSAQPLPVSFSPFAAILMGFRVWQKWLKIEQ